MCFSVELRIVTRRGDIKDHVVSDIRLQFKLAVVYKCSFDGVTTFICTSLSCENLWK